MKTAHLAAVLVAGLAVVEYSPAQEKGMWHVPASYLGHYGGAGGSFSGGPGVFGMSGGFGISGMGTPGAFGSSSVGTFGGGKKPCFTSFAGMSGMSGFGGCCGGFIGTTCSFGSFPGGSCSGFSCPRSPLFTSPSGCFGGCPFPSMPSSGCFGGCPFATPFVSTTPRTSGKQFYTGWTQFTGKSYFHRHLYADNGTTFAEFTFLFYPDRPGFLFLYDPSSKAYLGRYRLKASPDNCFSALLPADRKGALKDISERSFRQWGPMPRWSDLGFAWSSAPILAPPDELPGDSLPPDEPAEKGEPKKEPSRDDK